MGAMSGLGAAVRAAAAVGGSGGSLNLGSGPSVPSRGAKSATQVIPIEERR